MPTDFDQEAQRKRQDDWIALKFREWQTVWHDAFDRDPILSADEEFRRPDPIPNDIASDYRLIFGLSKATPQTQRLCFAEFPRGDEMQRRFESYLTGPRSILTEFEARELVADIAHRVAVAVPSGDVNWQNIEVMDRTSPETREIFRQTDRISFLFERNLLEPIAEAQLHAVAAELFLTEPLYATAGNFHELANWINGAMFGTAQDAVYDFVYRLWIGGWQLGLTDDGVMLTRVS